MKAVANSLTEAGAGRRLLGLELLAKMRGHASYRLGLFRWLTVYRSGAYYDCESGPGWSSAGRISEGRALRLLMEAAS